MAFKDRFYDMPVIGTGLRVQDRYKDDAADQFAASIGFFGFLSLFPLLLVTLSLVGFFLADDLAAQRSLATSITDAIPGFSGSFSDGEISKIINNLVDNRQAVGLVGLGTLLLSGLRVINAAMVATQKVFHVDVAVSGVKMRLRQVSSLAILGLLALLGVGASALVGAAATLITGAAGRAVGIDSEQTATILAQIVGSIATLGFDFLLFLVAYRLLSPGAGPAWREIWPGAVLAAIGWSALKLFGATYVTGQIEKFNGLYGTLGGVIGLLLLLYLAGRLYLYGAELSAVIRRPGGNMAYLDDEIEYEGEDPDVLPGRTPEVDKAVPASAAAEDGSSQAASPSGSRPEPARAEIASQGAPSRAPGSDETSAAVSAATRTRLAAAEAARDPRPDVRHAVAFAIAVGAVGGLVAAMRPWDED